MECIQIFGAKFYLSPCERSQHGGNVFSWRRDSILRPSERMSTILPQDHGVLAITSKFVRLDIVVYGSWEWKMNLLEEQFRNINM